MLYFKEMRLISTFHKELSKQSGIKNCSTAVSKCTSSEPITAVEKLLEIVVKVF